MVLELIKQYHGITLSQLAERIDKETESGLGSVIKNLIASGKISFIWDRYYPNNRTVRIRKKGEKETLEIIRIQHEISLEDLIKVIKPLEGDDILFEGYPIDESCNLIFEKTNNIHFDFDRYDYELSAEFDNSNDINGAMRF